MITAIFGNLLIGVVLVLICEYVENNKSKNKETKNPKSILKVMYSTKLDVIVIYHEELGSYEWGHSEMIEVQKKYGFDIDPIEFADDWYLVGYL